MKLIKRRSVVMRPGFHWGVDDGCPAACPGTVGKPHPQFTPGQYLRKLRCRSYVRHLRRLSVRSDHGLRIGSGMQHYQSDNHVLSSRRWKREVNAAIFSSLVPRLFDKAGARAGNRHGLLSGIFRRAGQRLPVLCVLQLDRIQVHTPLRFWIQTRRNQRTRAVPICPKCPGCSPSSSTGKAEHPDTLSRGSSHVCHGKHSPIGVWESKKKFKAD